MKLIEREMTATEIVTEKSNTALYCQASFNSDGAITLRNYDTQDKNSDEIFILSTEETWAIIELFRKLSKVTTGLPF